MPQRRTVSLNPATNVGVHETPSAAFGRNQAHHTTNQTNHTTERRGESQFFLTSCLPGLFLGHLPEAVLSGSQTTLSAMAARDANADLPDRDWPTRDSQEDIRKAGVRNSGKSAEIVTARHPWQTAAARGFVSHANKNLCATQRNKTLVVRNTERGSRTKPQHSRPFAAAFILGSRKFTRMNANEVARSSYPWSCPVILPAEFAVFRDDSLLARRQT